jgi:hypothetical protein
MKMIGENNINEIMKYEYIIPETTYNSLLSRIKHHDISKIYFNSKLDKVICEDANSEGNLITDYSLTKINPVIVKSIVDESSNNEVETFFLHGNKLNKIESNSFQHLNKLKYGG